MSSLSRAVIFDLKSGKRRRVVQVVFGFLAFIFFISFVGFGIGSDAAGGIFDAIGLGGGSSGGTDTEYDQQIEDAEETLETDPQNERALLDLVNYHYLAATAGRDRDRSADRADLDQRGRPRPARGHRRRLAGLPGHATRRSPTPRRRGERRAGLRAAQRRRAAPPRRSRSSPTTAAPPPTTASSPSTSTPTARSRPATRPATRRSRRPTPRSASRSARTWTRSPSRRASRSSQIERSRPSRAAARPVRHSSRTRSAASAAAAEPPLRSPDPRRPPTLPRPHSAATLPARAVSSAGRAGDS